MEITITNKIREACPKLVLGIFRCEVSNSETSIELRQEMEEEIRCFSASHLLEDINKRPEIEATRRIYKALGKDPNRYRPSAEALCRRIIRGIPIYNVNTLVDIINIVSIRSGFSIGGFDTAKVQGNIVLGVGTKEDEFEAIGRGLLNVEGLPLFRDTMGGIGTPTSDNERTKITAETTELLMVLNGYSGEAGMANAVNHAIMLLGKYAGLKRHEITWIV
jgi:DNA/RNA-binding domain of Phe-tRNA-synthetase-like protein